MSVSVWIYHSPVGERRHPRATLRERSGTEAGEYSEGIQRISLMLWQNSNGGFRREGEAPAEPRLRRSVALPKENPDDCPPPASPHFQRPSLALPTRETRLDGALGSEEMAAADYSGFVGDRLLLFVGRARLPLSRGSAGASPSRKKTRMIALHPQAHVFNGPASPSRPVKRDLTGH